MLKQRLITGAILILMMLGIVIYLPTMPFVYVTGIITLAAAWEWTNLMEVKETGWRAAYLILISFFIYSALFIPVIGMLFAAFLWWLIALILIIQYPKGNTLWGRGDLIRGLMGVLVLVPCWGAINFMRGQVDGIYIVFFLFFLVFGADTVAYFVGKKWGKHKLLPEVSPGKSVEGAVSAVIFAIIYALVLFWVDDMPRDTWKWGVLLSVVTVCFSIVGDLTESMMKRQVGLKDSGNLLPGHGGLLDRIDSLTAGAPIFALGALLIGMYT